MRNLSQERIPVKEFLDDGCVKGGSDDTPFPTSVRWIERSKPPPDPASIEMCNEEDLERWTDSRFAMPPYQFRKELGVVTPEGEIRPPNADERERLHGYPPSHTEGFPEPRRISFIGNAFHCVAVACLLATWAVKAGYLTTTPDVATLWERALQKKVDGLDGAQLQGASQAGRLYRDSRGVYRDPGIHNSEPEESFHAVREVMDDPYGLGEPDQDTCYHLIQDEGVVSDLHQNVLPPDEYYDELGEKWAEWWPTCNPALLTHMKSVLIAFDTAIAFSMSFGIAKFALAQEEAKLVGEIVGKYGRKPNPAIVRAIKKWPPIYTLKQLQEFLVW